MPISSSKLVNLDALIPREDLETKKPGPPSTGGIPVSQLATGQHYLGLLRKPLFQRETDDWSIDNVVSLIRSFRDGHLIPAVILWTAQGYTFVIDGAHRLSALIAWVNDDYGDGHISQNYYKNQIPKAQKDIAAECRKLVAEAGCAYSTLSKLTLLQSRTEEQLAWSSNIAKAIETQYVVGDANVAAESFLAINQRAVQIDPTEKYMIINRTAPNVIAARALVNSAKGHAYWGSFEPEHVERIEERGRLIYNSIFEPEDAQPHTDIDLQPAGQARTASGLRIALDLVNVINGYGTTKQAPPVDETGEATARVIDKTYGIIKYIAGQSPASLSLHPAVYFWGSTGNHRPSLFLAMVSLMQELVQQDALITFTLHRARFEEFLLGNGALGKEILGRYGGWSKSVAPTKRMLKAVFEGLASGKTESEIAATITGKQTSALEIEAVTVANKWRETKSALRHRASLESAQRCAICKARMVIRDASDDHIQKKSSGGHSGIDNAQLTHRFCNHGFKEHFTLKGQPLPAISLPTVGTA